jgi:hypothetical protein
MGRGTLPIEEIELCLRREGLFNKEKQKNERMANWNPEFGIEMVGSVGH